MSYFCNCKLNKNLIPWRCKMEFVQTSASFGVVVHVCPTKYGNKYIYLFTFSSCPLDSCWSYELVLRNVKCYECKKCAPKMQLLKGGGDRDGVIILYEVCFIFTLIQQGITVSPVDISHRVYQLSGAHVPRKFFSADRRMNCHGWLS